MKKLSILIVGSIMLLTIVSVGLCAVSATLYVYTDADYDPTHLAPVEYPGSGAYQVFPSQIVYIQIASIAEFASGDLVQVKISYKTYVKTWNNVEVHTLTSGDGQGTLGVGDASAPLMWQVGLFDGDVYCEIPFCETLTVHYKDASGTGTEYVAGGVLKKVGHLHSVPETQLGTIGPLMASLVGIIGFVLVKKRKSIVNLR